MSPLSVAQAPNYIQEAESSHGHYLGRRHTESYGAPFETKWYQYFQNLYWTSSIYIRYPISISDV